MMIIVVMSREGYGIVPSGITSTSVVPVALVGSDANMSHDSRTAAVGLFSDMTPPINNNNDSFLDVCAVHGFWLPISEIPDCPSIDGSIPAAATDTDGGLGIRCTGTRRTCRS